MARASRYFLLGEGHLMRATLQFQIVNVYCSTSKGTKAMTRGHGGNCLHCLLEVSGLMKTIFVKSAILLWHSICGSRVRPCPLRSNTGTQGVQLSVSFTHPSPPFSLWNTPHGKVVPMTGWTNTCCKDWIGMYHFSQGLHKFSHRTPLMKITVGALTTK